MTETIKTRNQLITRAAQKLSIIASGQSLEAEDAELIDSAIDGTIADLAGRGVVTVSDDDAIEIALFEWLADCLADNVAADFGKERNPQKTMYAEAQIRRIIAQRPSFEPLQSEYF